MKMRTSFPAYAANNADFVTRNRKEGKVIDFQVDVETLPISGVLCVHGDTIAAAAKLLGLPIQNEASLDRVVAERTELEELRLENERLRTVLGLLDGIRIGDMEKIEAEQAAVEAERKAKTDIMAARAMRKQESRVRVAARDAETEKEEVTG